MRWPVPVTYLPHSIMVRGAPPILLVGSTHDPETNYVWAHELRNQMPSAVLLTRDGDGHTSSWLKNSRTSDAIADYLITGADTPAEHRPPRLRAEDRLRVRAGHERIPAARARGARTSRRARQSAWSYVSCQPPQVYGGVCGQFSGESSHASWRPYGVMSRKLQVDPSASSPRASMKYVR